MHVHRSPRGVWKHCHCLLANSMVVITNRALHSPAGVIAGAVAIILLLSCFWAWQHDRHEREVATTRGAQASVPALHLGVCGPKQYVRAWRAVVSGARHAVRWFGDASSARACQ